MSVASAETVVVGVGMSDTAKFYLAMFGLIAVLALIGGVVVNKMIPVSARNLIKKHEGLRLKVYADVAGYKTIGWGHKLVAGETMTVITEQQAEDLLTADMTRIWNGIKNSITRPLTDNQRAAVMAFAFNVGASAFNGSTMLKKINAGDMAGAAEEFMKWDKARVNGVLTPVAGLTKRRADEKAIFLA